MQSTSSANTEEAEQILLRPARSTICIVSMKSNLSTLSSNSLEFFCSYSLLGVHYSEGTLMPILVNKLIFGVIPSRSPFLIRPLVSGIFGQLNKMLITPSMKTNCEYVSWAASRTPYSVISTILSRRLNLTSRRLEGGLQVVSNPRRQII
jgi:hypothetical protein